MPTRFGFLIGVNKCTLSVFTGINTLASILKEPVSHRQRASMEGLQAYLFNYGALKLTGYDFSASLRIRSGQAYCIQLKKHVWKL